MGTPDLINIAPQLTAAEGDALSQRHVQRHHVAIILLHWFNAIVWLLELTTGVALIASGYFRVAPRWFVDLVGGLFRSRADMLHFHIAAGITWTVVLAVYGTFGFRTYVQKQVLHDEIGLDRDDWNWLRIRALRLLKRSTEPLPPQGIYNAGQKLYAVMVYSMIPLIILTGLIMTFHLISTTAVAWAMVIHFAAVGMVVSGLMIHVYMGAVFPEEKSAFFSMITGYTNEFYAYRHHFKWWKEVTMRRVEYFHEVQEGTVGAALQPTPAAKLEDVNRQPGAFGRAFRQPSYWPPYVSGLGLGLVLLTSFIVMGEGLGASSGFNRVVVQLLAWVTPNYASRTPYWNGYLEPGQSPLFDFIVLSLVGVAIGGFVSGWLAGRFRISVDKGPRISARTRYMLALLGGILTALGARMARGCTSGLALSGGAVLSVGAFIFMFSVFAAGFVGAYFLRRYWL